jgi:eukaryotic-like serine/threonine-protein kinase
MRLTMLSERVQRQIDGFLDQAEEALQSRDWEKASDLTQRVLVIDPENADAASFLKLAETGLTETASPQPDKTPEPPPASTPTSFADGRYTVTRLLGEGGKKMVYLAHDATLDRDVAFGLIKTDGLDDVGRERILREAQAMGRMGTHPCIMPIYDLGEENGQPFMVQPPMGGGDIEDLMEKVGGAMPLDQVLKIANQTAQGLVFAHSKGIIHRDLKPGNVWLDDEGNAKIGDFGLAIATDRSRLTVEKLMVGTVNYMPPEQATGGDVTSRADLYSLGAMLYEMSTGRVPFMGDDDIAVISQHVNTPPVAPSWHNPKIPRTLDSLIVRLMSKDPNERPQTAEEVLQSLEAIDLSVVEQNDQGRGSLEAMAGGVFVGRQREMDNLKSIFEEVLSGKGRMVTLVGEPGIGKTRTAHELATYAGMRGAQVLWGRSYESGGAPPYWPWVQAIRSHVASTEPDALRSQMASTASVIAEIVTDIKEKLPDLPAASQVDDPESARFRLFDSIATFLKQASLQTPIVLMLEDLHWSDKPSLMLLEFVARELSQSKIMVIGNYRDMELNRRHPLSITLGDLTRERLFERVLLRGLQKHDVSRFIEIAAGIAPPTALVDAVFTQTEGNPLFVTETVRLLIQEGDISAGRTKGGGTTSWEIRIPEGVREVIGRRLDRLSERCNELLTIAAVIGRQFRFDVLKELMDDTTDGQLLDSMDEALSARIIEELPEEIGLYQFTHAQMQETLTLELSANRSVRMHAKIAEALESVYGSDADKFSAELAEHFAEAETVLGSEKLVHYSLIAGWRALDDFGYEEAKPNFERVLNSLDDQDETETRASALHGLARVQLATFERGDMGEAVNTLHKAFDVYIKIGRHKDAINAALSEIPHIQWIKGVVSLVQAALDIVPGGTTEHGKLLVKYGEFQFEENRNGALALEVFEKALNVAHSLDDQTIELTALVGSASINLWHLNEEVATEQALQAVRLAEDSQNLPDSARAHQYVAWGTLAGGNVKLARKHMEKNRAITQRLGSKFFLSDSAYFSSVVEQASGDWDEARQYINMALDAQPNHPRNLVSAASIELEVGDFASGNDFLNAINPTDIQLGTLLRTLYALSKSMRMPGYEPPFSIDLDGLELRLAPLIETGSPLERIVAHRGLAYLAVKNSDRNLAKKQFDALMELASPGYFSSSASASPTHPGRALGLLASLLGEHSTSEDHYRTALADCRAAEFRPELAWTCSDYAETLIERNNPADAEKITELQDEAIEITTELGMKPLLQRVLAQRDILKA